MGAFSCLSTFLLESGRVVLSWIGLQCLPSMFYGSLPFTGGGLAVNRCDMSTPCVLMGWVGLYSMQAYAYSMQVVDYSMQAICGPPIFLCVLADLS